LNLPLAGTYWHRLAQLAHLLDAIVARAVNLQHVHRRPSVISFTRIVVVVEIHLRAAGAIQAFGEDAGDGRLARAARAAEQIGVRDAVLRWRWRACR
jgi:hypothetical protein